MTCVSVVKGLIVIPKTSTSHQPPLISTTMPSSHRQEIDHRRQQAVAQRPSLRRPGELVITGMSVPAKRPS